MLRPSKEIGVRREPCHPAGCCVLIQAMKVITAIGCWRRHATESRARIWWRFGPWLGPDASAAWRVRLYSVRDDTNPEPSQRNHGLKTFSWNRLIDNWWHVLHRHWDCAINSPSINCNPRIMLMVDEGRSQPTTWWGGGGAKGPLVVFRQ